MSDKVVYCPVKYYEVICCHVLYGYLLYCDVTCCAHSILEYMFRKELIEMKKNDKKENLVEKREIIDNSTLAEMNEKYPKVSVNGVAYDLGLTYITIQTDYLGSANIRKLIKTYGAEIIAVICFFRTEMCQPFGWYCRIDKDNLENLIEKCAFTLKMEENKVEECYQALIDQKAFFVVSDESGTYLADTQQLYNFEILNNSRIRDRERKAKSRAKAAEKAVKGKESYVKSNSTYKEAPKAKISTTIEEAPDRPTLDIMNNNDSIFDLVSESNDTFNW